MPTEIFTILANAGSAAIVGLMFISYLYFQNKSTRDRLIIGDKGRKDERGVVAKDLETENKIEDARITRSEVMFTEHCKVQTETLATIHNGLNTQANAIKDLTKALADNTTAIAVLMAKFEERIPKKQ